MRSPPKTDRAPSARRYERGQNHKEYRRPQWISRRETKTITALWRFLFRKFYFVCVICFSACAMAALGEADID